MSPKPIHTHDTGRSTTAPPPSPGLQSRGAAKLQGHYQHYGVSGNMPSFKRYYHVALRLALPMVVSVQVRRKTDHASAFQGEIQLLSGYGHAVVDWGSG